MISTTRILIVDDEPNILKSLQRILEDKYKITTALGADAALSNLSNNQDYDIILSDLSMPHKNGMDFYYDLKKQWPGLEKKIIFMTGFSHDTKLEDFIHTIKNICLSKPFEEEALEKAIETYLNEYS